MAHYLFNLVKGDAASEPPREQAGAFVQARMWGVAQDEPHRNALVPGDLVLIYLGAPEREFIGRAELASVVHDWTPSEAKVYPGDSASGVLLAQVEEWDPPVPMHTVLSQLDSTAKAKADFDVGVVRITAHEYETAAAAGRASSPASHKPKVIEDDPHALEPTLVRLVVMAAAFFDEVPEEVLHPDDALKYLEAIVGAIDRIRPRDRSRFALLMHDEANRQPELKQLILSLIPDEASWAAGE